VPVVTTSLAIGALQALHTFSRSVAIARSLDEIFDASLACVADSLRVERSSILLLDGADVMRFRAWTGLSAEYRTAVEGHSPWAPDTLNPESVLVPSTSSDLSLTELRPVLDAERVKSVAFIPLTTSGRLIGKFMLYYDAPHEFTDDEVLVAEVLGTHIGLAVDRYRSSESAALNEQRQRALVDSMGVAAYVTDEAGVITYFNEEAAALWGRRPVVGRDLWCGSWAMFRPDGELLPHDQCPMAIALKEGRPIRDVEIVAERPDGERAHILPFPTPLFDSTGRLIGAINVMVDITERQRTEAERHELLKAERAARAQAEAAVRARDQFLSIASHELRNPVAGLRGAAQLLQRMLRRGDPKPGQVERYTDALVETSGRMARLLDDLLDVARLESGQLSLHPEETDVLAMLRSVIDECRTQGATQKFDLIAETRSATILADPLRLRQIVANLLDNAVKYSPNADEICVTLRRNAQGLALEVLDHGIGFPPEATDQLFVPFGRTANARSANVPGMGLGLHISRELAEMHGGTLRASSPGEGLGARMILTLPTAGPNAN